MKIRYKILIIILTITIAIISMKISDQSASSLQIQNNNQSSSLCRLVNKDYSIESNYIQSNLRLVNVNAISNNILLRDEAALATERMFSTIRNEIGLELILTSGFRSYNEQKLLFNYKIEQFGYNHASKMVMAAGHSEHQLGLAIDINTLYNQHLNIEDTLEFKWIKNNAHRFGFILRYPKDRVNDTGIMFEPWHLRYVGKNTAKIIFNNNWILEDYHLNNE